MCRDSASAGGRPGDPRGIVEALVVLGAVALVALPRAPLVRRSHGIYDAVRRREADVFAALRENLEAAGHPVVARREAARGGIRSRCGGARRGSDARRPAA